MLPANPVRSPKGMLVIHPALHLPREPSPMLRVFAVGLFAVAVLYVGAVFAAALA